MEISLRGLNERCLIFDQSQNRRNEKRSLLPSCVHLRTTERQKRTSERQRGIKTKRNREREKRRDRRTERDIETEEREQRDREGGQQQGAAVGF